MLLAMNNKDLSLIFDELCEQTEQILKELSINNISAAILPALTFNIAHKMTASCGDDGLLMRLINSYGACIKTSILSGKVVDKITACWSIGYMTKNNFFKIDVDLSKVINQTVWTLIHFSSYKIFESIPYPFGILLLSLWKNNDNSARYLVEESIVRLLCDCYELLNRNQGIDKISTFTMYHIKIFIDWANSNGIFPHKCSQINNILSTLGIPDHTEVANRIFDEIYSWQFRFNKIHQSTIQLRYIYVCAKLSNIYYDPSLFQESLNKTYFSLLENYTVLQNLDIESKSHISLAFLSLINQIPV